MEFAERKRTTEMLLDAASLSADIKLLENTNSRSRVLARRSRLHNLQFEIIWELLSFIGANDIEDNRIAYNANQLSSDANIAPINPIIAENTPKKNTLPRKKSTRQSIGKK